MNRQNLYEQTTQIFADGGEPMNMEQVKLLVAVSDLLNKAEDKSRYDLPFSYFEQKIKDEELADLIEGITATELKHLYTACYMGKKAAKYRDVKEPELVSTATRNIPWWMKRDALKHGLPDHFKVGVENAGYGVAEILHHQRK